MIRLGEKRLFSTDNTDPLVLAIPTSTRLIVDFYNFRGGLQTTIVLRSA